ncbi:CHAT domain-containing protein, partial [Frankia sp. CpI1-P]
MAHPASRSPAKPTPSSGSSAPAPPSSPGPGPRATRRHILDELGRHAWVHFACHGQQDLDEPSRNAVLLHDEPLTVLDVA